MWNFRERHSPVSFGNLHFELLSIESNIFIGKGKTIGRVEQLDNSRLQKFGAWKKCININRHFKGSN